MGKKSKRGKVTNKPRHGAAKRRRSSGSKGVNSNIEADAAKAISEVAFAASDEEREEEPATNDNDLMKLDLPEGLTASLELFTPEQRVLAETLCLNNQLHLFEKWSVTLTEEENKKKQEFMNQLERLDHAYPDGGLLGYIRNAKILLEKSKQGLNPLDGWTPSVPQGQYFQLGSPEYSEYETQGLTELGKCGFVLVAGGLGERLGYSGIKVALPVELATGITYLQYYIETILAIQSRYAEKGIKLPLCIMVSNDTKKGTLHLLKENNNFGMDDDQITIVQQGEGVPALLDNEARIALDPEDMYKVETKPHGHGDIHALIYANQVARKWRNLGLDWVAFFQDTNGLAFQTLPLALAVSKTLGLVMNSLAVPRKAKQAIGGIAKLSNGSGEERYDKKLFASLEHVCYENTVFIEKVDRDS